MGEVLRFRGLSPEISVIRQRGERGLAVNIYVLRQAGRSDGPVCLVDTGYPGRLEDLAATLTAMGSGIERVQRVFYTHTHIDHMGGGPDWAGRGGVEEHVMTPAWRVAAANWDAFETHRTQWAHWVAEVAGDDHEVARQLTPPPRGRVTNDRPAIPRTRWLSEGERATAGPFRLEWVSAAGHDPTHVALWDRERGVLFSGDAVLAIPTPLVRPMGDDTASYLDSLARLARLPVEVAYPGHGIPMTRFAERCAASIGFVEARNAAILESLRDGPKSLLSLARQLLPRGAGGLSHLFLTLANVESSVQYLADRGELGRQGAHVELRGTTREP